MESIPNRIKSFSQIINKYDTFIFDCDGTLWSGSKKLEEAFKTLDLLRSLNKKILFLTNATHKNRKSYQEKLKTFGFETELKNIYNASYLAVSYIKLHYQEVKKIYVVGMNPPIEDAKELGYTVLGGPDDNEKFITNDDEFLNMPIEKDIDAVLVGFDFRFNYYKMAYASVCL
jgi:phosphoglycolate/pyridoxal phosphate phosphatase family enzyme